MRRVRLNVVGWIALVICVLAALMALLGPVVFAHATDTSILDALLPVGSPGHPLGTDQLGRDVVALSIAGARSALLGPVVIALGAAALGTALGALAGWRRGWVDVVAARTVDLLLSLPVVLVAIVVAGLLGSGYWVNVVLLIVLFVPSDFRIVRAAVIEQRSQPYVEAALLGGTRPLRLVARHILPNVAPIEIANLLVNVAFAIVAMASLSYLGLGVPVDAADWGLQLTDAKSLLGQNSAAMLTPATLTIVVACAINLLGDQLGERADRTGGDDSGR